MKSSVYAIYVHNICVEVEMGQKLLPSPVTFIYTLYFTSTQVIDTVLVTLFCV